MAAISFSVSLVTLYLPPLPPFEPLEFNWQGKILATAVVAALIAAWPGLTWRQIGLGAPQPGSVRPFALSLAAFVATSGLLNVLSPGEDPSLEAALFQATMPGLQEELLFRGVLLASLNQGFPARRRLWGADVGWSLPATTALFASVHGVSVVNGQMILNPAAFTFTAALGFFLGWVRARTSSIWPCIVLHNTWNVLGIALAAVL